MLTSLRRVVLTTCAGAVAAVAALAPVHSLAATPPNVDQTTHGVFQEIALSAIGIDSQTASGPVSDLAVLLPAPGAPLASRGSFVRVFFTHSAAAGAGSNVVVSVNRQSLTTVRLDGNTAAGNVFEVPLPASILRQDAANLLQLQFTLTATAAPSGSGLFARMDASTMIHYQLVGEGERALSLIAYPYSLLTRTTNTGIDLQVVMPPSPNGVEMGAAWRILANLGRHAGARPIHPIVTVGPAVVPNPGTPTLMVGELSRFQGAADLLLAAGMTQTASGWRTTNGVTAQNTDGILAALASPADHQTPVLLATGADDSAIARSAAALVGSESVPLSGAAAVVTGASTPAGAPSRQINLTEQLRGELIVEGGGQHRLAAAFALPVTDHSLPGRLSFAVLANGLTKQAQTLTTLVPAINGRTLGSLNVTQDGRSQVDLELPAGVLVGGSNSLSLDVRQSGDTKGNMVLTAGSFLLQLPSPPVRAAALQELPFPFLDSGNHRPTLVLLGEDGPANLTSAASVMVALGSRSYGPAPVVLGGLAGRTLTDEQAAANLIVVCVGAGPGLLDPIGRSLTLFAKPTGVVRSGADLTVDQGEAIGTIETMGLPGADVHQALWVSGTSPEAVAGAGLAIYQRTLQGRMVTVDAGGLIKVLGDGGKAASPAAFLLTPMIEALTGVMALALVVLLLFRVVRRRPKEAW